MTKLRYSMYSIQPDRKNIPRCANNTCVQEKVFYSFTVSQVALHSRKFQHFTNRSYESKMSKVTPSSLLAINAILKMNDKYQQKVFPSSVEPSADCRGSRFGNNDDG